jgi:hypothetical protein
MLKIDVDQFFLDYDDASLATAQGNVTTLQADVTAWTVS